MFALCSCIPTPLIISGDESECGLLSLSTCEPARCQHGVCAAKVNSLSLRRHTSWWKPTGVSQWAGDIVVLIDFDCVLIFLSC